MEKGLWEVNLVPHAPTALDRLHRSGAGDRPNEGAGTGHGRGYNIVQVEPCGNSLITHLAEWPVGRYAKTHHHGGGAVLLILRSEGYTLMWPNELRWVGTVYQAANWSYLGLTRPHGGHL